MEPDPKPLAQSPNDLQPPGGTRLNADMSVGIQEPKETVPPQREVEAERDKIAPPIGDEGLGQPASVWVFWSRFCVLALFGAVGGLVSLLFQKLNPGQSAQFSDTFLWNMLSYMGVGAGAGLIGTIILGNKDIESVTRQKFAHVLLLSMIAGLSWRTVYVSVMNGDRAADTITREAEGKAQQLKNLVDSAKDTQESAQAVEQLPQLMLQKSVYDGATEEQRKKYVEAVTSTVGAAVDRLKKNAEEELSAKDIKDPKTAEYIANAQSVLTSVAKSPDIPTPIKSALDVAVGKIPTRVYIQTADTAKAKELQTMIQNNKEYVVPEIETIKGDVTKENEIRVFHDSDRDRAEQLRKILKENGKDVSLKTMGDVWKAKCRPGIIEVWLPN